MFISADSASLVQMQHRIIELEMKLAGMDDLLHQMYANQQVSQSSFGSGGGSQGIVLFSVTETSGGGILAASSPTAPTNGSAVYEDFDGTNISDLTDTEVLWNYHDKGFATNALVPAFQWRGVWWIFDVDSCTYLF